MDDNRAIRDLLRCATDDLELRCDEAADVESALAQLSRREYSVAVVDLALRDRSGIEVLDAVRRRSSGTRCIVVTAYADVGWAARAVRARIDDYLVKPFPIEEFRASLERSLRLREESLEDRSRRRRLVTRVSDLEERLEEQSTRGIRSLVKTLEARDPYTQGHSVRVAELCLSLATFCGLSRDRTDDLVQAALLHDLGKVAVPDSCLRKEGPLTPAEVAKVRVHPRVGYDILLTLVGPGAIVRSVLRHHEWWDGTGYPGGVRGRQLRIEDRILSICDSFDAMTSERPYRAALPVSRALEEIRKGRGTQFEPGLADLFCEHAVEFCGGGSVPGRLV
ncbi:MAG: HD domain-containing phosphohydrolase [Planctomycetota bacterium]